MTYYVVGAIKKQHDINVLGRHKALDLTWADGMVGVLPVFETMMAAELYAGDSGLPIFCVESEDE